MVHFSTNNLRKLEISFNKLILHLFKKQCKAQDSFQQNLINEGVSFHLCFIKENFRLFNTKIKNLHKAQNFILK